VILLLSGEVIFSVTAYNANGRKISRVSQQREISASQFCSTGGLRGAVGAQQRRANYCDERNGFGGDICAVDVPTTKLRQRQFRKAKLISLAGSVTGPHRYGPRGRLPCPVARHCVRAPASSGWRSLTSALLLLPIFEYAVTTNLFDIMYVVGRKR